MIRSLRLWHRRWFLLLALVLPILLWLALTSRAQFPTDDITSGPPANGASEPSPVLSSAEASP